MIERAALPNALEDIDVTPPWDHGALSGRPITRTVKALATALFERICDDSYSYGTRLPSERQLAADFNVSRNTARQALGLLEEHQIVERRAGSGSFVAYRHAKPARATESQLDGEVLPGFEEIAEITSPLELNVVRTILEPEIVRLAVINMSARDIAKLREIVVNMDRVTTNAGEFAHLDQTFHMQLARGTRNPLLSAIYLLINQVRNDAHWSTTRDKTYSPKRIREYKQQHRSILEAIQARDIETAVELVKLHMTELQRDLMRDL